MRRIPTDVMAAASGAGVETMAIVLPNDRSVPMSGSSQMTSVIVGGARTPMGRLLGNLKGFPATALGAAAIRAALERSGVSPDQVQYVIMGQVLQAGAGQMSARQAAVGADIPMTVPSLSVNKVCLSGITAIALADQLIRAGEFDIVVAGGMESMTKAPHLLVGQREGYKYGEVTLLDHMAFDGLTDAYDGVSMGESTDRYSKRYGITREEQDAFGAASHQKAAAAQKNGAFAEVGVQSTKELGVSPDIVNVNGGAIALGHPIGMSGARLVLTLALELKRRGGGLGAAALCGGGGQGDALLLQVPGD